MRCIKIHSEFIVWPLRDKEKKSVLGVKCWQNILTKKKKKTLSTLKCFIKFEFGNGFYPLNLKRIRLNKRQRKIVGFFSSLLFFNCAKKEGAFYASVHSSIKHSKDLKFLPLPLFLVSQTFEMCSMVHKKKYRQLLIWYRCFIILTTF